MTKKYSIFDVIKDTANNTVQRSGVDLSADRIAICNICPDLLPMKICGKCGCLTTSKVRYKQASCPLGKW